jgi:hypothetical protein
LATYFELSLSFKKVRYADMMGMLGERVSDTGGPDVAEYGASAVAGHRPTPPPHAATPSRAFHLEAVLTQLGST